MKTIKKIIILGIISLITNTQAAESFDLAGYNLLEQTQTKLMNYLEQRFSFGTSLISNDNHRFYANGMTFNEQTLLMNQMMKALNRIKYPKKLPNISKIEAGVLDKNYVLGGAGPYQEEGKVYLAKSTNWLQLVYIFSEKPQLEDSFTIMMESYTQKLSQNMDSAIKNETPKNYKPIIEAFKKYCSEPSTDVFRENLFRNLLENNFVESSDNDTDSDQVFRNEELEFTVKNSKENHKIMDFVFVTSKQERVEFTFARPCVIKSFQLIFKDSTDQIKKRIFLDNDLNIAKIASNNVARISNAEIEKKKKQLALRKDRVGIAIYDSGVDYNHVELAPYLFYKNLTNDERQRYEESKSYYINRRKNESDLKVKKKQQEERSSYVLMKEQDYANLVRENENLIKKSIETSKEIQDEIKSKEEEKKRLVFEKVNVEKTLIQKLLNQKTNEEIKLSEQIQHLDETVIVDLKSSLEVETKKRENASRKMNDLNKELSTFMLEEKAIYNDEMKKIVEQERINQVKLADFVMGVTAWDFYENDDLPYDYWNHPLAIKNRNFDHGTHVAGIIIRDTEDLFIFPLKSGGLNDYDALKLASEQGINIVNISIGTANDGKTKEEIEKKNDPNNSVWIGVKRAAEELPDLIVVAAAGNDGMDIDIRYQYPASFELPNIIAVASVNKDGKLSSFSNFGKNSVHLAAFGEDIESLVEGGKTGTKSGTSMATPFVTRVIGIMRFINPQLDAEEIKEILRVSVVKTEELKDKTIFGGYVVPKKTFLETCKTIDPSRARTLSYCK